MTSRKPKHSPREEADFYETPTWVTEAIIPHVRAAIEGTPSPRRLWEPACGNGAISRVLNVQGVGAQVCSSDLHQRDWDGMQQYDFLTRKQEWHRSQIGQWSCIITNPPYALAERFIERASQYLTEDGCLFLLLRLGILGAQARAEFWRRHPPKHLYITPQRPKFREDGKSDSAEYAWLAWGKHVPAGLTWLPTEAERYKARARERFGRLLSDPE